MKRAVCKIILFKKIYNLHGGGQILGEIRNSTFTQHNKTASIAFIIKKTSYSSENKI
jgi:hypothetical protein